MGISSLFRKKAKGAGPAAEANQAAEQPTPDLPSLMLMAAMNGEIDVIQHVMDEIPTFPWNDLRYAFREEHATEPILHMTVLAGQTAVVKLLLESGKVDGDAYNEGGYNALNFAAINDRADMIRVMLATGKVDANKPEAYGSTAIAVAARYGCTDVMHVLLEQPGLVVDNEPNAFARTPLMEACSEGKLEAVKLLVGTGRVDVNRECALKERAIVYAALKGHVEVVEWLMTEGGANVTENEVKDIKEKIEDRNKLQAILRLIQR